MKRIFLYLSITVLFVFIFFQHNTYSQICSNISVGFTPVNDLSTGFFRNYQGGLYPGGSKSRPEILNSHGINFAGNILHKF